MAVGNILIDKTMRKYGVPEWVKPYVYNYIKSDPLNAVKHGISFIDVKRKRGRISGNVIELPNSIKFDVADIARIVSLFYYGEEESSKIANSWSESPHDYESKRYADHFAALGEVEQKHLRAIRNLLEGLGKKVGPEPQEVKDLFEAIGSITDWKERIIAYDLVLRSSYGSTFGNIFYKVFYPVMPEYMRSFGKAFSPNDDEVKWGYEEAKRIITAKEVSKEQLQGLFEKLLPLVGITINANMDIAMKAGIEKEVKLLRDIAIAYPIYTAHECGIELDPEKEAHTVLSFLKGKTGPAKE
ncbi:MAG: hypothetical protein M1465_00100 [Candidatus Marsarchaeota archaeon]|nr:hypothetical protein [Candidatus Marsarchaeota archaeon]